jgi:hypothetical protein
VRKGNEDAAGWFEVVEVPDGLDRRAVLGRGDRERARLAGLGPRRDLQRMRGVASLDGTTVQ